MVIPLAGQPVAFGPMSNAIILAIILVVACAGSIAMVVFFLVQLPPKYFVAGDRKTCRHSGRGFLFWIATALKNLLGVVFVVSGIVMLLTPGQGVLTILIGVMLLDFPGKRRLERRLVARPGVLSTINRLRAYFAKAPLVVDDRERGPMPQNDA
jgi:hypothetical protein